MRIIFAASLLPLVLMRGSVQPPELTDPEAYRVYAALLTSEWAVRVAHAKTLVFEQETSTPRACPEPSGGDLETDWRDVRDDFRQQNAAPKRVRSDRDMGIPYVVVPRADILALFAKAATNDPMLGWSGFYNLYPDSGGYIVISAVGFNPEKTRAMVYMGHSCGGLCGGGTYYFLEKVADQWRRATLRGVNVCAWAS